MSTSESCGKYSSCGEQVAGCAMRGISSCDAAAAARDCTQTGAALLVCSSSSSSPSSGYMQPASSSWCTHGRPASCQAQKDQLEMAPALICPASKSSFSAVIVKISELPAPPSGISLPEAAVEEEDGEDEWYSCGTPKAQEHRIPDPPAVCPPPPHKKRRVDMTDRNCVAAGASASPLLITDLPSNFFSPAPSDLHTYPEIIRALFRS